MKTILFPTDFSIHADNALTYAIKLSEKTKSQLVVFYSTYTPKIPPQKDYKNIVLKDEIFKQTMLESLVAELCKKHKLQIPENIIYDAKNGNPVVENILSAAKKYKAEMIIIGTHGTTGLKKVLFGSTTAGLISKSKIPVLAIPQGYNYAEIKKIIYASDMKNLSKEVSSLLPIAEAIGVPIEVLYLDYWDKAKEKETQFNKMIMNKHLKNVIFVKKIVSIEKTMAEHITNYTKKNKDSILAMFPEERNFFENIFFHSITEKIAFHPNKPLLSIRKTII